MRIITQQELKNRASNNWHTNYMAKVKQLPSESLHYIIKDCKEAMRAMPNNPKNGIYQDEIHYCVMELHKRGVKW